ncbi:glycosyltransferase [Streptomyces formicae]|uniref:glycosyltransferase n=1 Tax=Streptomyces formicae TaxID=1616117 RepID=UPI003AEF65ED
MHLWFLTPTFPPVHGGSETQIYTLAAGLVRRGHQVDVLTERYPGTEEFETCSACGCTGCAPTPRAGPSPTGCRGGAGLRAARGCRTPHRPRPDRHPADVLPSGRRTGGR